MSTRVWLITGAGRGLGESFARAALEHGDHVVATARDVSALDPLVKAYPDRTMAVALDATDPDSITAAIATAKEAKGRIDVLVNNAGYGLGGAVEEISEKQLRRQMEVNFFGPLACTRAVLPLMREQGSGHIVQVSSVGGLVAFLYTGMYHASKWALEGISETLAQEVASFGIKVTIIEPGPFRTEWNGPSFDRAEPISAYDDILAKRRSDMSGALMGTQPGDPEKAAQVLVDLVNDPNPPLRLLMGHIAADTVRRVYDQRLQAWDQWDSVSRSVDFDDV
jgi:NAD(P)-dependent dehydrogenase (short-subunit alcohol dehydrogenase family)